MKAGVLVRHGAACQAFEIRDMPDPSPNEGQVRIQVETFGLNFADVLARLGLYQDAPPLPTILGFDVVGHIDAIGMGVQKLSPGMRVVAMTRFGGYASHVVTNVGCVAPIPEDFNAAAATALATQYCTAWLAAIEMACLQPGDQVLIHAAAGGVGTALVQIAKLLGCTIYGTTGSEQKLDYLRRIGVDYPIYHREKSPLRKNFSDYLGNRINVIFDSIGGTSVRRGLKILSAGGRMISFGVAGMAGKKANMLRTFKTILSFGVIHPVSLLLQSKSFIGINLLRIAENRPEVLHRCLLQVVSSALAGNITPIAGKVFPVSQLSQAHEWLGSRKSTGKVAVQW